MLGSLFLTSALSEHNTSMLLLTNNRIPKFPPRHLHSNQVLNTLSKNNTPCFDTNASDYHSSKLSTYIYQVYQLSGQ